MAATIKPTLATAKKFKKVTQILVTPYDEDGVALGQTAYQMDNIVADSTSLTQDDPETNEIACETRDEPVDTVTTLGSYQFTTNSADIQKELLTGVMGFVEDTSTKILYAPASYKDFFAEVRLKFENGDSLVLPKVKLNNKIEATTLKTGLVQAVISGTAFSVEKTINGSPKQTPFYVVPKEGTDADAPTPGA